MNNRSSGGSFLDSLAARGVAVLVFFACGAALAYIHRDDLFPPDAPVMDTKNDFFTRCYTKRSGDIDKMLQEGLIKAAQADRFRGGAEAMCRDQARKAQRRGGAALPSIR